MTSPPVTHAETPPPSGSGPLFERRVPFLELLEIRPLSAAAGHAEFQLTVQNKHLRTLGILHGGVVATLLDTAMGYAAGTLCPDGQTLVTAQLNLNFTRPALEGETLSVVGDVIHGGSRTAVTRGEVRRPDGGLVATGTATFLYIPISAVK